MNNTWERLLEIFQGNASAVGLMQVLKAISHAWDDLIDGEPVDADRVNSAFFLALCGLRRNEFYRLHMDELDMLFEQAILSYIAANDLETRGGEAVNIAHVARYAVGNVAVSIAAMIGGHEWGKDHAAELMLMANNDSLESYRAEIQAKYATRM